MSTPASPVWARCRDAFEQQIALTAGSEVRTILDVGAHTGDTAALYAELFPRATVHCFEPAPASSAALAQRFAGSDRMKPVAAAASDRAGRKTFFVNQEAMTSSLFPAGRHASAWVDVNLMRNVERTEVDVVTIDDYARACGLDTIDILKMDIQGGELLALQGTTRMLERVAVRLVYTEVLLVPLYEGQAYFHDVYGFLARFGYTLFDLFNCERAPGGQVKWADALFMAPA
jgi:FkbM family methyltransferase